MARAPRTGGMIARTVRTTRYMNFHNQAVTRSDYQGVKGHGFSVEFLVEKGSRELNRALVHGSMAIRDSSIDAVVAAVDETKQRMRTFLDAHFTGSVVHGNNHRRATNAASQSMFFHDDNKGQFTGLIYSKLGYKNESGGFVDFMKLHMRGGTVKPRSGNWIRLDVRGKNKGQINQQTGFFPHSQRDTFFVESKDGKKLFQLRRTRGARPGERGAELLATLVRSLTFTPSLQGLETIMAQRGVIFERHFDSLLGQRLAENGGAS